MGKEHTLSGHYRDEVKRAMNMIRLGSRDFRNAKNIIKEAKYYFFEEEMSVDLAICQGALCRIALAEKRYYDSRDISIPLNQNEYLLRGSLDWLDLYEKDEIPNATPFQQYQVRTMVNGLINDRLKTFAYLNDFSSVKEFKAMMKENGWSPETASRLTFRLYSLGKIGYLIAEKIEISRAKKRLLRQKTR